MITNFPANSHLIPFGGLIKFFFIPVDDIDTEPEIFAGKLIGDYTFKEDKALLTGYFDRDSGKLDINDASSNKGTLMKNTLTGEISMTSVELDELFCEMRCKKFIVFVIDFNGIVRVLGRVNCGATFDFNFTTKEKIKTSAVYTFRFSYESSCKVPYTTTQITDIC